MRFMLNPVTHQKNIILVEKLEMKLKIGEIISLNALILVKETLLI